jgi:hypothetical protein
VGASTWLTRCTRTRKPVGRCLTGNDGAYLLIAKNNQSGLRRDLELFFADPPADRSTWLSATTCEKGRGRIEIRTLAASTDLNEYFARDWRGIAQVFRLERTVIEKGERRTSVVYGFTSLSPEQADPARLLALLRAHWASANRLPWRRDVTLDEDHSQVRTRRAPQVLAVLNNALLALLDCLHVPFPLNCVSFRPVLLRLFASSWLLLSSSDFRIALR